MATINYTNLSDVAVAFTFPAMTINRSSNAVRNVTTSIGGIPQVIFDREDVSWDITTSEIQMIDVLTFRAFLSAVIRGGSFTIDLYDTNDNVPVYLNSNQYSESRMATSDYFTISFTVREL